MSTTRTRSRRASRTIAGDDCELNGTVRFTLHFVHLSGITDVRLFVSRHPNIPRWALRMSYCSFPDILIYRDGNPSLMSKSVIKESLAEKTRMYIDAHPSIKDCVAKGLINYSSLARMIMKDIGVDNEEAVMIACRRYASKLSVTTDHELSILRILKDSRLEMRTKTCIVTAKNDWSVLHKMDNLFKDLWNENSIMQCVQSASAVTIIADTLLKERIIDTVGRFNLIKVRENLVEIAVKSPEKIVDTSGVIAYLITNLSDAGINIEETVSCHTDTIFIVGESDMINAYSVLTKCIQSAEETIRGE